VLLGLEIIKSHHGDSRWPKNIHWRGATRRLPFADGSVECVYTSHFLEHIPWNKATRVVHEVYRVLEPGGVFRVVVPDLVLAGERYLEETKRQVDCARFSREAHDRFMRTVAGGHFNRVRPGGGHLYAYDFPTLFSVLEKSGFVRIRQCSFQESPVREMGLLENRPGDSLHIEATKPG
jgi:ubiquinone/menaquinone biosynthesis C-methylase UbiE